MKVNVSAVVHLLTVVFCLLIGIPGAGASWIIDPERFHASVHGQIGCQECHEDISKLDFHPDPRNVTKRASDFFQPEECLACHDAIMDDLHRGVHGKLKVKAPNSYRDCLRCHDPHYQISLSDPARKRFKPDKPVGGQCGACHERRNALPPFSEEGQACLRCHHSIAGDDPGETERVNGLCLHCHGMSGTRAQAIAQEFVPLIDEGSQEGTPHADLPCTTCHPDAAAYTHEAHQPQDCGQCHPPHDERVSGSVHMTVSCQSCHLKRVRAVRDKTSGWILWERERSQDGRSMVHEMVQFDTETACKRCHFAGNLLGAVSMVLPAKSVICMPCHVATFSLSDTISIVSLVIFVLGMALFWSLYLTGSLPGSAKGNALRRFGRLLGGAARCVFGRRVGLIVRSLFWDVLLQRRLYRLSRGRWAIHALIFYGFVVRFIWGVAALVGSVWKPDWPVVWHLVNKDYSATAFVYDLTGLMILTGVGLAFGRGWFRKVMARNLPEQDRLALGLIAAIVLVGFVLEGMRIALNGYPEGSAFSLIGYAIGLLFEFPRRLVEVYGFVWYIHAALTGVFIAYIPFSRLLHIFMAPVVLAMNACKRRKGFGV